MLNVPDIGEVRVVWQPSDLTGPDSDGHVGRSGYAIRAIVCHRVVGSLESMTNNTFYPTTDNILKAGERRVSSQFGIGFWGTETRPRIVQYVAIENTAYCNGQNERDRAACDWELWKALGRPPANEITVSIEHEDNASIDGGDGTYVVREEIIKTSIALVRLLLSGNATAIRGAGIHCSDSAAAQLGRIKPSRQTIIDHHVIAPVTKPYCWRAIGDDKGFPQARYLNELGGSAGEEANVAQRPISTTTPKLIDIPVGRVLYDLDGTTRLFENRIERTNYPSPCGRGSSTVGDITYRFREIYMDPDGSGDAHKRRSFLVRVTDAQIHPLPTEAPAGDCADEIAAAIAKDRASARIVYG